MNELVGVLFYTFRSDSQTFWAFTALMHQMKDLFTMDADSTGEGIYSRIDEMWLILHQSDYYLCKHLRSIDFPLATVAMRWITTLLAMDLTLPDSSKLWDVALLASRSQQLVLFATCMSVSYMLAMGPKLLQMDDLSSVELACVFGKSCELETRSIVSKAVSIFAYQTILRGQYEPNSDEPLIDIVQDVLESAKSKLVALTNENITKENLQNVISSVSAFWNAHTQITPNTQNTPNTDVSVSESK